MAYATIPAKTATILPPTAIELAELGLAGTIDEVLDEPAPVPVAVPAGTVALPWGYGAALVMTGAEATGV